MKNMIKKILIILMLVIYCSKLYSQTELYKKYEHRTEFTVMCIMQFPITDSVKTDITLFVANSKEDLWSMVEEFNLGLEKDEVYSKFATQKKYSLYMYNVHKDNIKKRYGAITNADDYKNMMRLAYSYNKGVILIFHDIDTEERYDVIRAFLTKSLKNNGKIPGKSEAESEIE